MSNQTKGYRLVEIIVVILTVAILAAYAVPRFLKARRVSEEKRCHDNILAIEETFDIHRLATGDDALPASLADLYGPGKTEPDATFPVCPLKGHYLLASDGSVICDHPPRKK